MAPGRPGSQRPPPVSGVPPAELADGRTTAKGWLLALVEATPLDAAPTVPAGLVAQQGPELCAAVLEAVGTDAALDRLEPGGDRHDLAADAGAPAGSRGPAAAVEAVALLRAVLWRQLRDALAPLDAESTGALGERVAHVAERVAAAAVDRRHTPRARRLVVVPDAPADPGPDTPWERPWVRAAARIAARPGDSPAAFALLALEAEGAERMLAADPDGAGAALASLEARVRDALPSAHTLIPERPRRLWVLAPGAHRSDARTLGDRLAAAAVGAAGQPLAVCVGIAACPEDGTDPRALADRAEEAVIAASR